MTPKFDELYTQLMEDLSQQGKGLLANQGGGGSSPANNSSKPITAPSTSSAPAAKPATNLSGQKPLNSTQQDFGALLQDPNDNTAADAVLNHLTTNNIDFNDPKFAETPEGQAIGQRIQKNPKFADALDQAQQRLIAGASAATKQAFATQ